MLRSIIIVFFIALLSAGAFGQSNDWPISPKHKRKLERVKDEAKRKRLLAKYLKKDSAKYSKVIKETLSEVVEKEVKNETGVDPNEVKSVIESERQKQIEEFKSKNNIPDVPLDSGIVEEVKTQAARALKDSLGNYVDIPDVNVDSTTVGNLKENIKALGQSELEKELGIDIPDIPIDSTTTDKVKNELKAQGRNALKDELGADIPDVKLDSTFKDQAKTEITSRGKQILQDELGTDIPDIKFDSTTVDQLSKEAEKRAMEAIKKEGGLTSLDDIPADSELGKLKDYQKQLEQTQQELKQGLAKQKMKEKMAASAKKFIQDNASQISEVQSKMGELKKKYSYVPNSNDLSTAKKRSSLKGESFWKRLVIGGNFNVSKTNPLRVDLSPVIGYKINKLFEVGLTGAFRTQFKADRSGITQNGEEVFGFSIFADHMVFKNFFGHLEGESLRTNTGTPENQMQEWKQTLLVGVGRKFNVAKWLEMQALVLYNPLHDNTDGIYNSPVVFKTGIRLRK